MKRRHRAHAYITHGKRLLVFEHVDFPEAGIQVPAGTVRAGEAPDLAVMREAHEETGLGGLELVGALGDFERDMTEFGVEEIQHGWFYHLQCGETPPDGWRHDETHGGTGDPIRFELYWVSLPDDVPDLIGLQGAMLGRLCKRLGLAARP
jgi:8-oxo-dGTP pyrophosphatase MutT (NUDIX family)